MRTYLLGLKKSGFEQDLESKEVNMAGNIQYIFNFKNGYGASVIKGYTTYGSESDLWELAVIKFNKDGHYHLDYSTKITVDVIGYLSDKEVYSLLWKIRRLKKRKVGA